MVNEIIKNASTFVASTLKFLHKERQVFCRLWLEKLRDIYNTFRASTRKPNTEKQNNLMSCLMNRRGKYFLQVNALHCTSAQHIN